MEPDLDMFLFGIGVGFAYAALLVHGWNQVANAWRKRRDTDEFEYF